MKKENNQEERPDDNEETSPILKKSKPGIGRILFRGLIYSLLFFFLLIVSAGIVLEYFFPAEEVRAIAEAKLSKKLKLPLSIQKISFSLLSGMQVDGVTLGTQPLLARVKKIVLDYDLTQLLQGKLVINQILVDHPQLTAVSKNGVWNFQPLLDLAKPVKDKPTTLPAFPLAQVDIKQLSIRQASARLDQDGKLSAHIDGLSLEARGKASLNAIDLKLKVLLNPETEKPNISFQSAGDMRFQSRVFTDLDFSASNFNRLFISGAFGLQDNRIRTSPTPDVAVEIDAEISLQPEVLNLKKLWLTLGKNNHIKVSGNAANFSKDPSFKLMIHEASFQLEDLLVWGKQRPISGKGLLKAAAVKISGHLPGFVLKNLNIDGGTLSTKNLWINHPGQNARLEDMNAELELKEITLHDSQLGKASVNINMQLKKAMAQKTEIKDWNQSLSLNIKGKDEVFFEFNTDMKSAHYDHPQAKEIFLPVHAEGSGHFNKGDLNNLKLSYRLGTETLAKGTVTGSMKNFGKSSLQLEQNFSVNLAELANQLPKKFSIGENLKGTVRAQTSVTGKLDEKFSPAELKGRANFQLEGLTIVLKKPSLNINNLNTRVSFPLEFHADKGVRISHLDFHTDIQSAETLNTWKIKTLKLETEIKMNAFHNLKSEFGTLPVQIDTRIALENLKNPALSLTDLKADLILKTDLKTDDVRNTRASGNLSFKNLSAMKMLTADEWSSRFKLEAHDKSLTRVRISQKTQIDKPSFHRDDLELALESVSLETASRQNLKEGEVNIDTFILQSPNLVTARLKATLKEWGKNFEIEGQIEKLQLGSLWDHLPSTIKSDLENLKAGGTLDIDLKTKGRLPENKGSEAKPVTPTKPLWARLLVPANAGDKAPVEISAEIKLHNGFLNFSGLPENPEKKIHAEALNTKTRLTFKNGHADLSGNFSGKLEGLGKIDLNPEFEFHYVLDNLNTLRVKQHQLKLMNVEHSLQGQISGLKPFITGQRPVRANELLNRLDIKLANTNTIDISQAVNANPLFVGLETQGIIAAKIKFYQSAGKKLNVDGSVEFDQVNLRLPSVITLKNLSGTFPFSKTLLLDPKQMKEKSGGFFPAQKKFFTRLRDFSRYKNIIRADSLEVKGQILKDIGLDVVFKDNRLMVEKFIFDVLGGTVAGNLFLIQDRQGPVLKFSTEFAGIDSSKLLAVPVEKKIDARVDGNLQVELKIKTGSEGQPVSLDQLSVKIAITRIGTQTLDRLLLFLDPEESKPAIMDTRAKLKLATPHRVRIVLENGNLNVEAWLKSDLLGTFKAPELKRVPIAALKRFNTIHEHLQALKDLQQISNYLSARGLQFKDEKIILHH